MIHFYCPGCQSQVEAQDNQFGVKVQCGNCGQRLQVPQDPRNKTVLGSLGPPEPPLVVARVTAAPPPPRTQHVDDEDEDRPSRRRRNRRRASWECPGCGSTDRPLRRNRISQTGWILFIVLLFVFFPLFFIGLLMTEDIFQCPECGFTSPYRDEFDPDD